MQATDMKYLDEHLLCIHDKIFKAVGTTFTNTSSQMSILSMIGYHDFTFIVVEIRKILHQMFTNQIPL